jgi:putative endonuclease
MKNGGTERAALGVWGEERVADYLIARGHRLRESRWRCRFGELDLVTEWGGFLCFVEVKLRKSAAFAPARAAVTLSKQKKLILAAECYLSEQPTDLQPRFDVAEVYAPYGLDTGAPNIIYWENAFALES